MNTQKNILLVDDDKDLVASVKTFLQARGYLIHTAHNGTEARAFLNSHTPDLVVLDIMMDTDAEGFQIAHKLKAEEATRRIPVVILSGFMNHLDSKYQAFEHIMGRDWPAAKFFEKPVDLKQLADSIGRLLAETDALQKTLADAEVPA